MSRRYTVAPAAIGDLDEIWLYIAQDAGVDAAERIIQTITDIFPLLSANPGIGRRRPNLGSGIRSFPIANYRIYYRQDNRGRVRVLHVWHGARDERNLFR